MNLSRTRTLSLLLALAAPAAGVGLLAATPAQAAPADDIRINEVVTTGSVNDSIELVNKGTAAVDVSGWILKDNNSSSKYQIAAGTTLAPGAFRSFDVSGKFGLGSSDQARLYLTGGTTLVDSFTWTSHSNPSWSRCPDGTGAFGAAALSLGAANTCGGGGGTGAWPGASTIATADASNAFGGDVSGLYQEGTGVMWAAQNSGKLWRLVPNGTGGWKADTTNGWTSGKTLKFPTGSGSPDDEGVTLTGAGSAGGVYVASERNSASSGTSRLSVLRYDVSGTTTSLTATREWNLTAGLPSVDSNGGLEAVTWVPDSALTGAGFVDAATGMIYGYVLEDGGTATKIASISSGLAGVMELQWEPQASRMWVVCDNTCNGQHKVMSVNGSGALAATATYNRPTGMGNINNEGFSVAGASECVAGSKPVYWSDDCNTSGHAIRKGSVTC